MSDFKAKVYKIRFPLGSAADPAAGAYTAFFRRFHFNDVQTFRTLKIVL